MSTAIDRERQAVKTTNYVSQFTHVSEDQKNSAKCGCGGDLLECTYCRTASCAVGSAGGCTYSRGVPVVFRDGKDIWCRACWSDVDRTSPEQAQCIRCQQMLPCNEFFYWCVGRPVPDMSQPRTLDQPARRVHAMRPWLCIQCRAPQGGPRVVVNRSCGNRCCWSEPPTFATIKWIGKWKRDRPLCHQYVCEECSPGEFSHCVCGFGRVCHECEGVRYLSPCQRCGERYCTDPDRVEWGCTNTARCCKCGVARVCNNCLEEELEPDANPRRAEAKLAGRCLNCTSAFCETCFEELDKCVRCSMRECTGKGCINYYYGFVCTDNCDAVGASREDGEPVVNAGMACSGCFSVTDELEDKWRCGTCLSYHVKAAGLGWLRIPRGDVVDMRASETVGDLVS